MGKKINPRIFRIGTTYNWNSRWFSQKNYAALLEQDVKIRKFLEKELRQASVDRIILERTAGSLNINIATAKPGVIIGRGGKGVEEIKRKIKQKFLGNQKISININIKEVSKPALSARIVMQDVIFDLEKRIPFRRTVKSAINRVGRAGAQGVKIIVAGRLNGVEIARQETFSSGKLPLSTLRADIDYCRGAARTIYGAIGVKVWIYKGEVLKSQGEEVK